MKPILAFLLLLPFCAVLLGDSQRPAASTSRPSTLLTDLVRLTRAGSSTVAVLAYAKANRRELPPEVGDADLRWLRDSGVSETVVSYMSAIDVRASDEGTGHDVAVGSSEAAPPQGAYSYAESEADRGTASSSDGYAGGDSDGQYDSSYPVDYDYGYDYGYDTPYAYGYSPYPPYFIVNRPDFFGRFHRRDHRFDGHRGFDRGHGPRGHRGSVVGRGGLRDPWRERGFVVRRGSPPPVVRPRGPARPAFARGGFGVGPQGPRGRASRMIGPRGFAPRGPNGFSGPRGGAGFSSGSRAGGGFSRGPRVASGSPGGRGRR